ncbi:phosphotransferase enzyme family protein [Xylaria intraflava]|nr:phosphotransferase enzyme family protein [Xylaria intraflava]
MDFDDRAKEQSDLIFRVWVQNLLRNQPEELAAKLAFRHCPGTPVTASRLANGAFNVCYRVTFEDGKRVVVRFTALGRVVARREKVGDEIAVMEYLAQHTAIPVPKIFGSGDCAVGPYVVMSYIEGKPLTGYLRDPSRETDALRPNLPAPVLRKAYFAMADLLLELAKPEFPSIGAIARDEAGAWTVSKRALTFNMNRLAQFSNIPHSVFTQRRFDSAADFFEELARQHFWHLELQRNDAVADDADCRKKYVARCLFRRLSREIAGEHCRGPFRLFCDDLRPDSLLVDASKLAVAGVVDWEFTYAAPVEFTHAAPWWLLLERPEAWEDDLDEFLARFMPRFRTFIEVLRECEAAKIADGSLLPSQRLSAAMEKSMENGMFWVCLASRHSSMFDEIYWKFIDPKFFGPFTTMEDRLCLLSAAERTDIDAFVEKKMLQASEGSLASYYTVDEIFDL